jgi:hydroxyacylglutathione hydrolase
MSGRFPVFSTKSTDIVGIMGTGADLHARLLAPADASRALRAGAAIVDIRAAELFDAGHAPGAVNVPGGADAGSVAAQLIARDVPVIAMGADASAAAWAAADLDAAGFRRVLGAVAGADAGAALGHAGLARSGAIELDRLADELATGAVLLVDVREAWESAGRLPGSVHMPLPQLRGVVHLLPEVPTVTACSDGRRAAAAASALRRWGHRNVWRADGGGVADLLQRPIGLDLLGAA